MRTSKQSVVFTPFRLVITFVVLALIGVLLIPRLQVNLNPQTRQKVLSVYYSFPYASPDYVELKATAPIENALSQISELTHINSVSKYNSGEVTLYFNKEANLQMKRFEVSSLLRQLYADLPQELSYPVISQNEQNQRDSPMLIYSIAAPLTPVEISEQINNSLANPIRQHQGIKTATIQGVLGLRILITFNIKNLEKYQLSKSSIIRAVQLNQSENYLGISKFTTSQNYFIKRVGNLSDINQLAELTIKSEKGAEIKLKDVAQVQLTQEKPSQYYRINQKNAIRLVITPHEGLNKLLLTGEIKEKIRLLENKLPSGYEIKLEYDDSKYLQEELDKIYTRSSLSVLILSLFILIFHRNFKYLFVLISGVIINLGITCIAIYFLQLKIHLYTLAGLTVSFGLIVDNAIVMLDYFHKKRNKKVFLALLAASLTTIAALLLVLFLPEEDRLNLTEFSVIVAINLAVSLGVALWYTPALYQLLYKENINLKPEKLIIKNKASLFYAKIINWIARYRKIFIVLNIIAFGVPVFMLPSSIKGKHWEWYNKTIGSDFYQEEMRIYIDKALGGALRLFVRDVFENSGYRTNEQTKLYVNARMEYGHTLGQMNNMIAQVEQYLSKIKGLDRFVTTVYSGQYASIVITFTPANEISYLPYQLKNRLIANSIDWGGVEWSVYGVGKGFSNSNNAELPSFRVEMRGYNYNELEQQAEILANKLVKHKRIQSVDINERVSFREKTSKVLNFQLNTTTQAASSPFIAQQISLRTPQNAPVLSFNSEDNRILPIYIEEKDSENFSKFNLLNNRININEYQALSLQSVGELELVKTANSIYKEDRQYIRVVGFKYFGSFHFGEKYLKETLDKMDEVLPLGYSTKQLTRNWDFSQVKRQYGLLGILIIAIFFICSILFESFWQPFLIILTVPLSFIGLFLTFALLGFYFDQGGYAAFILLGGIVVNSSIFIIHEFNNLKDIKNNNERIVLAIQNKIIPILLTIFSTAFGLIPFLLEGDNEIFWFSLAVGTIGGLIFSIYVIFVFLPVIMFGHKED